MKIDPSPRNTMTKRTSAHTPDPSAPPNGKLTTDNRQLTTRGPLSKLLCWWPVRIAMVLGLAAGSTFLFLKSTGQLFPGPVSAMAPRGEMLGGYASHAEFEQECKHCHVPIHCLSASRCQGCHLEVARELMESDGLHARLPGTDRCHTCHTEHQGREAEVTEVPLTNIDHAALTGFSLERHATGADGAPVSCEDCHPGRGYAVEDLNCVGCHREDDSESPGLAGHEERFGNDCLLCHDGTDRMVPFDHELVYALEGAHAAATCEACHQERVFAGLAQDCASCHAQPGHHEGVFGADCARCHTTMAWRPAALTEHAFDLNHTSAEGALACATCHVTTYAEHRCDGCHEHAPALVAAQHEPTGITDTEACATCHRTGRPEEIAELRRPTIGSVVPENELVDAGLYPPGAAPSR